MEKNDSIPSTRQTWKGLGWVVGGLLFTCHISLILGNLSILLALLSISYPSD